jgi:carbonic anhydrase
MPQRFGFACGCGACAAFAPVDGPSSPHAASAPAHIPKGYVALTRELRDALTSADVLRLARLGNERFRTDQRWQRDLMAQIRATAEHQFPAAALLSCMDSRAAAEFVLDLGIGDVFNTRTAGNVVDPVVLGGLEYACRVAGAKAVIVMGHTGCGAVTGAIKGMTLGNLTSLLGLIAPAIEATPFEGERNADNPAFVDAVARTHVGRMVGAIRAGSEVLGAMEREGDIAIAGAMYDIASGMVDFMA